MKVNTNISKMFKYCHYGCDCNSKHNILWKVPQKGVQSNSGCSQKLEKCEKIKLEELSLFWNSWDFSSCYYFLSLHRQLPCNFQLWHVVNRLWLACSNAGSIILHSRCTSVWHWKIVQYFFLYLYTWKRQSKSLVWFVL